MHAVGVKSMCTCKPMATSIEHNNNNDNKNNSKIQHEQDEQIN